VSAAATGPPPTEPQVTERGAATRLVRALAGAAVGAAVLAQVAYPLVPAGAARHRWTVLVVVVFATAVLAHAAVTRGPRAAAALALVTAGGGLAVEAAGTTFGFPFGRYAYADTLGWRVLGVPVVIGLGWTMLAWPAWLAATRLVRRTGARILVAACALASWDLFLDPQMVAAGHWRWEHPSPALPGVEDVPLTNYAGWFAVAVAMAAAVAAVVPAAAATAGRPDTSRRADLPMHVLYLWTYGSSVLAHAVFLGLPASAAWGGAAMGSVAVPLALTLYRSRRAGR
jgi:uncharacterized membrane protein